MTRRLVLLAAAAALLGSCTAGDEPAPDDPAATSDGAPAGAADGAASSAEPPNDPPEDDDGAPAPAPQEPPCRIDEVEFLERELTGEDAAAVAVRLAEGTHRCADVAVVAADDPWVASLAAVVAHAAEAPLLLADTTATEALASTLSHLEVEELITVGLQLAPCGLPGTELRAVPDAGPDSGPDDRPDDGTELLALAVQVAEHLGTDRFLAVADTDTGARAAALTRMTPDLALLPLPDDPTAAVTALPPGARLEVLAGGGDAAALTDRLVALGVDADVATDGDDPWARAVETAGAGRITWLADPEDGGATAVAAVAAAGRGQALLPVDGADLRADRERTDRLRRARLGRTVLVGDITDEADWQLATVLEGEPLPGGGFRLFEDERMVALYGSVETSALGVLGEQGLDATVERVRRVAEPYGADGMQVLPAFEIITTIASATEQPTGDYSRRTSIDLLRPWVDRAADEGIYVFLDLQSGRTDFLTQAQEYEELLREPHVGLALDPEWRLGPDEFHLRQIGSVAAEEVQEVADWLAELTRAHRLPEKLLVLHQFRFSMLPDRDTIVAPPELAVVVHMDGQGPIDTKYDTYGAITAGVEDRWLWGWKNFYDEDSPTPTPTQVLGLDPQPVLVTYQ